MQPSFVFIGYFSKFLQGERRIKISNPKVISRLSFSLSGGELFDRVADETYTMTESEVVRYIRQVCEGLRHMHEQGIVHLDIKVSSASD